MNMIYLKQIDLIIKKKNNFYGCIIYVIFFSWCISTICVEKHSLLLLKSSHIFTNKLPNLYCYSVFINIK